MVTVKYMATRQFVSAEITIPEINVRFLPRMIRPRISLVAQRMLMVRVFVQMKHAKKKFANHELPAQLVTFFVPW